LFDPALPDLSLHERLFAAWYAARLSRADDLADAYAAKLIAAGAQPVTLDAIEAGTLDPTADVGPAVFWQIIIHLTFVVSGVMFAVMDWISDSRAIRARALHAPGTPPLGDGL
jgi:hypothetical protein